MHRPGWAPDAIDIERPSVAHMYGDCLGGSHHFAVDRAAVHQLLASMQDAPLPAVGTRPGRGTAR